MERIRINMLSNADKVDGQGVGSAYLEQVSLIKDELSDVFDVVINDSAPADIIHCHTILPEYLMKMKRNKGVNVAYVHFLPDTLDGSISLPKSALKVFKKYITYFYNTADHLIVVNPIFIDDLVRFGIERRKIHYIPNYVSKESFYQESEEKVLATDFEVTLISGETVKLSDFRGQKVLVNFWATWCPPCKAEMPDIQALYEDWGENGGEVIVLGVANPKTDDFPYNQDVTREEVETFLSDGGYTYPVVMDLTGDVFSAYGIRAFPTTFMIDKEGNIFGYVESALTGDVMESIVQQTMSGKRTS